MSKQNTISVISPKQSLQGEIRLPGSKSMANRMLMICHYAGRPLDKAHLPASNDSQVLHHMLTQDPEIYDAHHAGTSSRFVASYLAFKQGTQILTGSERLQERPIAPLLDALTQLGASIRFLEKENALPVAFDSPKKIASFCSIDGSVSSQFISSLLMLAPTLPQGMTLEIKGSIASRSYLDMTLSIMRSNGITVEETSTGFVIDPQEYSIKSTLVEPDWSSASYIYGLVSVHPNSEIFIPDLKKESIQGDQACESFFESLGVTTRYVEGGAWLRTHSEIRPAVDLDFENSPDIFQTISTVSGIHGIQGLFTGLHTLAHKETDRIAAMRAELKKVNVALMALPPHFSKKSKKSYYMQEGKAHFEEIPSFPSYKDHRMAMSLSLLSSVGPVIIEESNVVEKSYPHFWSDLVSLGFKIEAI